MAARCAKPGCEHHATAWFVFARADCVVVLHDEPVDGSIALCPAHLARFSVPDGWTLERQTVPARPTPESAQPKRAARTPWFSTVAPPTEQVPVSGGMLARAFHGPQAAS